MLKGNSNKLKNKKIPDVGTILKSELKNPNLVMWKEGLSVSCYFLLMWCEVFYDGSEAIVAVIVWWLDLQLLMQSVPITTDVVSSNAAQGEVYNIMW